MATTNTADNNEPNQELALLDAESYYNVPNRAELLKDLKDFTPADITALKDLDFEVTEDNNVKNLTALKDHVVSATGKILKLFGYSSYCNEAFKFLEKRDEDGALIKHA